jgi:hypothetical protein
MAQLWRNRPDGILPRKYGVFEVKARIKTQNGLWPAIWFLGVEGEWPSCGEIDLMEYYQGNMVFLKSKPESKPKMVSGLLSGFLVLRVNGPVVEK